jgi:hypothetical protein
MKFTIKRTSIITVEVEKERSGINLAEQAVLIGESFFDYDRQDEAERRETLPLKFLVGRAKGTVLTYKDEFTMLTYVDET